MLVRSAQKLLGCKYATLGSTRSFAGTVFYDKIGDKIPVSFMKDQKAPEVLPDSEYPEWVFSLTKPLPTKADLLEKYNKEGASSLTDFESKRLQKLLKKELLHQNNLMSKKD